MSHCNACTNPRTIGKVTICDCPCVPCRNSTMNDLATAADAHQKEVADLQKKYDAMLKK